MRSIRRVGGLAVAGLLLSAVAGGSAASAATPAAYAGSASGYALKLTLANQGITAGASAAKAASDGTGEAEGSGALTALPAPLNAVGDVKATNPPGETKDETCGTVLPPTGSPLSAIPVSIGLGCGSASATGTGATSAATANGKVAGLEANLDTVLNQIPVPVVPTVQTTLSNITKQLCAGIPAQLQPQVCAVTGEIQVVADSLTASQTLNGDVGSSTSGVSIAGNSVTTESTASGAIIRVLPNAVLNGVPIGEPLITITVSRANAKILCDLSSGNAVPSFDPAIVRVKFSNPLAAILPNVSSDQLPIAQITLPDAVAPIAVGTPLNPTVALQNGELTVTPGSTVVLLPGTPLQTEIVVGAGSSKVNPDKTASATADGVKIHALQLAPAPLAGGLLANLAHAEAAGGCVAATADAPPAPAAPEITRELPRTGPFDGFPWLPVVGVTGLALAVLTRRAIVRSR